MSRRSVQVRKAFGQTGVASDAPKPGLVLPALARTDIPEFAREAQRFEELLDWEAEMSNEDHPT